jgi:putative endonuclease
MRTPERRAREARGRRGEDIAAWRLRLAGYAVVARRHKTPVGEIDLVVRRGRLVAIVEVKTRALNPTDDIVAMRQRRRIARAAEAWLAQRRDLAGMDVRFDVVIVRPWRWPRHIRDAWRP